MKVGEFDVKQPDPWSWRNPGFDQKDDHPVLQVSRNDAQAFCAWVSKKTGKTVVLPTEAQWEYACRAGTQTRFSFGDEDADLGDYAWYARNSMDEDKGANMTHPVGQKKPNAWGLYDMHGNAEERCADYYGEYAGAGADPTGPKGGSFHVLRGGSWMNDPGRCRSANRFSVQLGQDSNSGFRVAMVAAGVGLP
jgi:formylglycine-generating enzyme required for sulfatase activity